MKLRVMHQELSDLAYIYQSVPNAVSPASQILGEQRHFIFYIILYKANMLCNQII